MKKFLFFFLLLNGSLSAQLQWNAQQTQALFTEKWKHCGYAVEQLQWAYGRPDSNACWHIKDLPALSQGFALCLSASALQAPVDKTTFEAFMRVTGPCPELALQLHYRMFKSKGQDSLWTQEEQNMLNHWFKVLRSGFDE